MEFLIGLLLFGMVIYFLPYIITGLIAIFALFMGILVLIMAGIRKIFG